MTSRAIRQGQHVAGLIRRRTVMAPVARTASGAMPPLEVDTAFPRFPQPFFATTHPLSRRWLHNHANLRQNRLDLVPLPKRIILMRHGESLGNADENLYAEIPDWKIPLTRRGERQTQKAALDLHALVKDEAVFCYCSPYKRTQESWRILKEHLVGEGDVRIIGVREEPRIAEQQFGNFQNPRKVRTAKAERRTFGRFFFRFPNGEAGLDVYNRVSSFLATLSRDLHQLQDLRPLSEADSDKEDHSLDVAKDLNIVIVTHGLTLRLLLMRYFQLSVEEFEQSWNPQNARLVVMDRIDHPGTDGAAKGRSFFRLNEEAKEALNLKGDVSNEKPIFFRGDALLDAQIPYDLEE